MDHLTFERRHANEVWARVYRDDEGAGYRPACLPPREDAIEPDWPYLDTIDEARELADHLAHPDCDGLECGLWVSADMDLYRP